MLAVFLNFGDFKKSGLQFQEFYPKLFLNKNTNLPVELVDSKGIKLKKL